MPLYVYTWEWPPLTDRVSVCVDHGRTCMVLKVFVVWRGKKGKGRKKRGGRAVRQECRILVCTYVWVGGTRRSELQYTVVASPASVVCLLGAICLVSLEEERGESYGSPHTLMTKEGHIST